MAKQVIKIIRIKYKISTGLIESMQYNYIHVRKLTFFSDNIMSEKAIKGERCGKEVQFG